MVREGYKQTEIGVIPEDWQPYRIGDVVSFSGGSQPPRSTFVFKPKTGYLRLIQIRDYKTDVYETYIPEELAKKKCTEQDVMIGRYGPPIFQILRGIEGAYNVAIIKTIPSEKIDREFLYQFIKNDELFKLMEMLSQRSSGQTGVELPALREYPVALPPLEEQRSISQALSDVDALIASLDKAIAKKRAIKTATMQQLLTGKKRLPGFGERKGYKESEIGIIPENWEVISIQAALDEKYIEDQMDGNHGELYPRSHEFVGYGVPYVGANDFLNGRVSFKNCKFLSEERARKFKKGIARDGDVLFAHNATVGPVALLEFDGDFLILSTTATYFRCNLEKLNNLYFRFVLETQYFAKQYRAVMAQSTRFQVPITTQRKFLIGVAPIREQQEIATVLSDMDAEITALETRHAKTQALKQGMMQKLLTGRVRLV